MTINEQRSPQHPRAVLVGVELRGSYPQFQLEDSLDELQLLAHTAGVEVVGRVTQRLARIDPATCVGSGKLEEIRSLLAETAATTVIFDDELSPRHQRELEKALGEEIQVLDRSALILDIFAQHARTREGALQVELAQYEYRLPRLTRQWTHLARQAGGGAARGGAAGVGLRGPGETQLEVDRREIGRRIARLKRELEEVRAHRQRHRQQRLRAGIPIIALVGYTNAGKSTLLNALTGADVYVADQLFATLDPTTRRMTLPGGRIALLSDTVGFIQKLPVSLVAAFRATLEEITEADVLLHVVDGSHPRCLEHIDVVEDTLAELEASRIPKLLVLNKTDRGQPTEPIDYRALGYREVVPVSAIARVGLDRLCQGIEQTLAETMIQVSVLVPYEKGAVLAALHEYGIIESESHLEQGVQVTARVPQRMAGQFEEWLNARQESGAGEALP